MLDDEANERANRLVAHATVRLAFDGLEQQLGGALGPEARDAARQLNAQRALAAGVEQCGPQLVERRLVERDERRANGLATLPIRQPRDEIRDHLCGLLRPCSPG